MGRFFKFGLSGRSQVARNGWHALIKTGSMYELAARLYAKRDSRISVAFPVAERPEFLKRKYTQSNARDDYSHVSWAPSNEQQTGAN